MAYPPWLLKKILMKIKILLKLIRFWYICLFNQIYWSPDYAAKHYHSLSSHGVCGSFKLQISYSNLYFWSRNVKAGIYAGDPEQSRPGLRTLFSLVVRRRAGCVYNIGSNDVNNNNNNNNNNNSSNNNNNNTPVGIRVTSRTTTIVPVT